MKFKNYLLLILAAVVMISSSSCFEITEKLSLEKDGSGKWSLYVDMGEMLSFIGMMGEDALGEMAGETFDASFNMTDLPDSLATQLQYPEVSRKGMVGMQFDAANSVFNMTLSTEFEELGDITKFLADSDLGMKALEGSDFLEGFAQGMSGEEEEEESSGMFGGEKMDDYFFFKKKEFSRVGGTLMDMNDLMGDSDEEGMDEETMSMMKMFLADVKYRVEYTMPGKVKKVDDPSYTIDGKTVSKSIDLLDLMEGKENGNIKINFK